jgi:hypothetical protein
MGDRPSAGRFQSEAVRRILFAMARTVAASHFVGRAAELGRLHAAFDAAKAGDAIALCIAGEAGVGKTRLVTRFAEQVSHAGGQVLLGGCIDLGEGSFAVRARDSSAARPRAPYYGPRAQPRGYR